MKRLAHASIAFCFALLPAARAAAADYFVAVDGDDAAPGSSAEPWLTIQHAADTLEPGDTVTVHAGVYREWIDPARGGSKSLPITYQAADGEDVYIKGSELLTDWQQDGTVWHVVVPNTTFGSFNPYATTFAGDYLTGGSDYHLGQVYLDDQPYAEVLTLGDAQSTEGTWYAEVDGTDTTITANFGNADPNTSSAEINVREYIIFPSKVGLGYITIKGFHVMQGATQWAPPTAHPQDGLIGSNFGMGWTIENNYVSDSKTVCISGGTGSGDHSTDINQSGNHVIRYNTIERCGQAGIAGQNGLVASTIQGNLIQDIHTPIDFVQGYECAGIKIHTAVDVLIEDNVIRRVGAGAFAVWLDYQAQGSRLTRNVMYDLNDTVIKLEADHGPTLIDDNVMVGANISDISEATIFVHNLMNAPMALGLTDSRTPAYYQPHTTNIAGNAMHASADNKYYNNIMVSSGLDGASQQPGFASDYNVLYAGAAPTSWGDAHSISDATDPALTTTSLSNGVDVSFNTNSAPTDVACPLITHDFIGLATLTKQGIENHDGSPITIDHDITGAPRDATHPTAGPLEMLQANNTIQILAGAELTGSGADSGGGTGGSSMGGTSGGGTSGSAGKAGSSDGNAAAGEAGADTTAGASSGGSVSTGGTGTSGGTSGAAGGSSGTQRGGRGGSTSSGGAGTANAGQSNAGQSNSSNGNESAGCSCSVPGREGTPLGALFTALVAASGLVRRRRASN
jgi:MYXO-CTERM domain-containing protein